MTTDSIILEIDNASKELLLAVGSVRGCRQFHRTSHWVSLDDQEHMQDEAFKHLMTAQEMIDFAITKLGKLPFQMEHLQ